LGEGMAFMLCKHILDHPEDVEAKTTLFKYVFCGSTQTCINQTSIGNCKLVMNMLPDTLAHGMAFLKTWLNAIYQHTFILDSHTESWWSPTMQKMIREIANS
jgi:hypothetical protein